MSNFVPSSRRVFGWGLLVFASLSLDCRRLTADPAKAQAALRPSSFIAAETIYDGGLKGGWQDWGWGTHDLSAGAARINLSQYGGWILHHDSISTRFGGLVFRVRAPSVNGPFLEARLANGNGDESFPGVSLGAEYGRPLPEGWSEIYVAWSELNPSSAPFDRITLHAKASIGSDLVQFDKIVLTRFDAAAAKAANADAPQKHVSLVVNCRAPGHPISPYIYGMAGEVTDTGATTRRWGGNRSTRYNWQANVTNAGKDWFFENAKGDDYRKFLSDDRAQHLTTALTIPIVGWVAKDPGSFGFPISVYGPQHAKDPYRGDAGDGTRADGNAIKPNAPTQTSVEATPDFMKQWVAAIVQQDAKDHARSVQQYILDNEPSLWSSNHRDIHPDPLSYDELLDRTIRYGSAIRAADPQALIAGPAEWGWTGYFYSARDTATSVTLRPDRRAHGDVPLLPWYLGKLREHDQATGIKVLDILDVHFYPQGQNVYSSNSDAATAALRLRSTRSLWDPTYKDESWINDNVQLIPRLKAWVARNYPGLAVSLGEYNFGAEQHISGGLAQAEALGRFGTEGLDYAYYWFVPPKNSPVYWAFRAFRNFDGKNGRFLDRSLDTKMDAEVSLFASRDDSGKHLVLIALNLSPSNVAKVNIGLTGCATIATRRKYSYDAQSTSLVDEGTKSGGTLDETLQPYSINVFDVALN
ncbi:MAG TPA: glycoside hydrolase family 44 protein [Polyangiaceae bacterium]|nr:glycoside hydrolase family 44 protein [Polyangiaceae bacterium]